MPIENNFAADLQLIVPNLHRRYSGVTATSRAVSPRLAKMFRAAWLGPDKPDGIAGMGFADLLKLWRRRTPLIWHARRNDEMIAGLLLRALGWPLKLLFTSAAQRHHTWLTRWLIRRMDAIIATSSISASFLKREATVVMHGVDTDVYAPPADRAAAFAEAGLPGRYAIGCFGRVRAQKGSDVFVEAMCRLLPRYPDFTAVMVGAIVPEQQGFANELKKRIEAAGLQSRIVITGELAIEEVQRWYRRLTIYAFTSRNEGFGLTLIEAMSSGAALVASRAGAAELVVEDGVTGVLTPPGDVDALVAALEPLMRDPAAAAAMGKRARARVEEKFSLDAEARQIADGLPHAGLSHHLGDERVEIAAGEQEAGQPDRAAGLDVALAVADDKAAGVAHRPMLHQVMDHAGRRFAPVMILEIARDRSVRMMRAISDVVDDSALRGKLGAHPVMQRVELGFGEKAARDAGLVGEEENEIAGVVEPSDRLRRIRHPADAFPRAHVAVVMVDDAVAVEKRRRPLDRAAHVRGAPPIIACSISSQMPCATARWICWITGVSSLGAISR